MKKYVKAHEEYEVSPLTISPNHHAWPSPILIKLLDGHKVGVNTFCEHKDHGLIYYCDHDAWDKGSSYLIQKILKDKTLIKSVKKASEKISTELINVIHNAQDSGVCNFTNQKLARLLRCTYRLANELSAYGFIPLFTDHLFHKYTHLLKQTVVDRLKKEGLRRSVPEVVHILSSPVYAIPSRCARIELLELALKTKRGKLPKGALEKYHKKWFWINYGHLGPGTSIAGLRQGMRKIQNNKNKIRAELNDMKTYFRKLALHQKRLAKEIKLSPKEKYIFQNARTFTYLKGLRMEVLFEVYALWGQILDVISKRYDIPKHLLYYASKDELSRMLIKNKKISKVSLKERSRYCIWVAQTPDKYKVLVGRAAREYLNQHVQKGKKKITNVLVIHGTVASPGYATGRVKIINKASEVKKIQKGDILVSVATNPSLLPAMEKAVAFVTDAGGVTSHAAIVAREMKKPCIIGTKIASKVLKDGELIELDTKKGDIRKI